MSGVGKKGESSTNEQENDDENETPFCVNVWINKCKIDFTHELQKPHKTKTLTRDGKWL